MPLKMVSHNHLLKAAEGGKKALDRAASMGIDLVRIDMRWSWMCENGTYLFNQPAPNRWHDYVEPTLRWTKEHGMRTLVNLLAFKAPPRAHLHALNAAWRSFSGGVELDERDAALWSAWAAANGVPAGAPTQKDYVEALVDHLAAGQAAGHWDIAGFCVLNEPNTYWPAEDNWRRLRVRGLEWYGTPDHCRDLMGWLKDRIRADPQHPLRHVKTVVNLYSHGLHWRHPAWKRVAEDPNLDALGIDIYWDQFFGLFAFGKPRAMQRLSARYNKPWWVVETGGATGRGRFWKDPSCARIRRTSRQCIDRGVDVLGYYRLWGKPGQGLFDYSGSYNIYVKPGQAPEPTKDGHGEEYYLTIQGI